MNDIKKKIFKAIFFWGLSIALSLLFLSCGKNESKVSSKSQGKNEQLLQKESTTSDTPETIIDSAGNIIKLNQPINRIVVSYCDAAEVIRSLNVTNNVVGVGRAVNKRKFFFPKLAALPSIGIISSNSKVIEKILNLNPDLVVLGTGLDATHAREKLLKINPKLQVVQMSFYKPTSFFEEVTKIGKVLGQEKDAEKYLNFINSILNRIKTAVELNDNKKPRVYFESNQNYKTGGKGSSYDTKIKMAGGINTFTDEPVDGPTVTSESIIKKRPEIIIKLSGWDMPDFGGYQLDDYTKIKMIHREVMKRPAWKNMKAVKDNKVWIP